jgi:hypothetical protein
VYVDRAAIIEHEQLVLRTLIDGDYPVPAQRRERPRRNAPAKRWVQQRDASNRLADHRSTDPPSGAFDFGQLRHHTSGREFSIGD